MHDFDNFDVNYYSGLSVDVLESGFESSYQLTCVDAFFDSAPSDNYKYAAVAECDMKADSPSTMFVAEVDHKGVANSGSQEYPTNNISLVMGIPTQDEAASERESGEVELGNFFLEDDASEEVLLTEVSKLQKKEKLKELCSGKNLEKMEGIWKKVICHLWR